MAALAFLIPAAEAIGGAALITAARAAAGYAARAAIGAGTGILLADQMSKAKSKAKQKVKDITATQVCRTCPCKRTLVISKQLSPKAAQHILDAQSGRTPTGRRYPKTLTLNRAGATARGRQATSPYPTKPGYDRDEYPPKVFAEGGFGASVRYVPTSDNRSAGGQLRSQLAGVPDGCKVTIVVGP
jgi:hypothetical protein